MKKIMVATTILALVALVVGCAGVESPNTAPAPVGDKVNFRLFISDEANEITNFESLNVTITQFGLLQKGGSGNWTTWNITPPETVDLKELVGDNATAIWIGEVPTDNYTKVFIYTANVSGVYTENVSGNLISENVTVKLPSGKLQISKQFTISENLTSGDFTVDFVFDVTVIKAGKSGKFILKPQIDDSGVNIPINDVTPKGKPKGSNKPEGAGKPENIGIPPEHANKPE